MSGPQDICEKSTSECQPLSSKKILVYNDETTKPENGISNTKQCGRIAINATNVCADAVEIHQSSHGKEGIPNFLGNDMPLEMDSQDIFKISSSECSLSNNGILVCNNDQIIGTSVSDKTQVDGEAVNVPNICSAANETYQSSDENQDVLNILNSNNRLHKTDLQGICEKPSSEHQLLPNKSVLVCNDETKPETVVCDVTQCNAEAVNAVNIHADIANSYEASQEKEDMLNFSKNDKLLEMDLQDIFEKPSVECHLSSNEGISVFNDKTAETSITDKTQSDGEVVNAVNIHVDIANSYEASQEKEDILNFSKNDKLLEMDLQDIFEKPSVECHLSSNEGISVFNGKTTETSITDKTQGDGEVVNAVNICTDLVGTYHSYNEKEDNLIFPSNDRLLQSPITAEAIDATDKSSSIVDTVVEVIVSTPDLVVCHPFVKITTSEVRESKNIVATPVSSEQDGPCIYEQLSIMNNTTEDCLHVDFDKVLERIDFPLIDEKKSGLNISEDFMKTSSNGVVWDSDAALLSPRNETEIRQEALQMNSDFLKFCDIAELNRSPILPSHTSINLDALACGENALEQVPEVIVKKALFPDALNEAIQLAAEEKEMQCKTDDSFVGHILYPAEDTISRDSSINLLTVKSTKLCFEDDPSHDLNISMMKESDLMSGDFVSQSFSLESAGAKFPEEFCCSSKIFKDSSDFDFLMKHDKNASICPSQGRLSVISKFDPLVSGTNSAENDCIVKSPFQPLIELEISNTEVSSHCNVSTETFQKNKNVIGEDEFKSALKCHEMQLEESLIQFEKEKVDQINTIKQDIDYLLLQKDSLTDACDIMRNSISEGINFVNTEFMKEKLALVDTTIHRKSSVIERDQALEDLRSVEKAFSNLMSRYNNAKAALEQMKENESPLKQKVEHCTKESCEKQEKYNALHFHADEQLNIVNEELLKFQKDHEAEKAALTAMLRKSEIRVRSLTTTLNQIVNHNHELLRMCEDFGYKQAM